MNKTVGDLLREARTKKGLALQTIAKNTGISDHNLLAIELDQFSLIEEEHLDNYLKSYAEAVDLEFDSLKDSLAVQQTATELQDNRTETSYDKLILKENPNYVPGSLGSRSSRRQSKRQRESHRRSILPLLILSLLALGILVFVGFNFWKNLDKKPLSLPKTPTVSSNKAVDKSEEKNEKEGETPASSTTPSVPEQAKLTTEGGGESMTVRVSNAKKPIEVEISFAGPESSWVGLSHSDLGEMGMMLGTDQSHKAVLNDDAKEAELSFGITQGISVKIAGQELDMSLITSTANSFVTIIVE